MRVIGIAGATAVVLVFGYAAMAGVAVLAAATTTITTAVCVLRLTAAVMSVKFVRYTVSFLAVIAATAAVVKIVIKELTAFVSDGADVALWTPVFIIIVSAPARRHPRVVFGCGLRFLLFSVGFCPIGALSAELRSSAVSVTLVRSKTRKSVTKGSGLPN